MSTENITETERFVEIGVCTVDELSNYNTECPECGALFNVEKNEQTHKCPQCGATVEVI